MAKKNLLKEVPISQIAECIGATIIGTADRAVTELVPVEDATQSSLSFIRKTSKTKLSARLANKNIGALIIPENSFSEDAVTAGTTLLVVKDPLTAIIKLIPLFFEPVLLQPGISPKADIDPSAEIGSDVTIGAFTTIGAFAKIEDGVTLYPHVVIYPHARVGARSIVHSNATIREECIIGADSVIQNGAVIGADGFGYAPDSEIGLKAIPQVGNVSLADRVDVGANSCIDRGTLGSTKIGLGTKIDNLVQIGHNVLIGQFAIICGQAGIAGSAKLGNQVVLGGNAGVSDHVTVADGCRFAAKTAVLSDIDKQGDYAGYPAFPARQWHRCVAALRELPDVLRSMHVFSKDKIVPRAPTPFLNYIPPNENVTNRTVKFIPQNVENELKQTALNSK